MFGFQIAPSAFSYPGASCVTLTGEVAGIPICVVRKGARRRLTARFCVMDAPEHLIYLRVLNLISCYLRLEPFPILYRTTTDAISGLSEVLVT